jgi:hypothetical protein
VNNELEIMCMELVVAEFQVQDQHLSEITL